MRPIVLATLVVVSTVAVGWFASCSNPTYATTGRGTFGQCFGNAGETCTGTPAYEACIEASCDMQLQAAFGASYKSASYTGSVCETYIMCENVCDCGDTGCQTNCESNLSSACAGAISAVGLCEQSTRCMVPVCVSGDEDAGVSAPDALPLD